MITRYLIAAVLVILVGYGIYEALPLILGPSLSIAQPTQDETIVGGVVDISGTVHRSVSFEIDGAPVIPDVNGTFTETLALPRGTSILEFVASDRFGHTITTTRTIFVP